MTTDNVDGDGAAQQPITTAGQKRKRVRPSRAKNKVGGASGGKWEPGAQPLEDANVQQELAAHVHPHGQELGAASEAPFNAYPPNGGDQQLNPHQQLAQQQQQLNHQQQHQLNHQQELNQQNASAGLGFLPPLDAGFHAGGPQNLSPHPQAQMMPMDPQNGGLAGSEGPTPTPRKRPRPRKKDAVGEAAGYDGAPPPRRRRKERAPLLSSNVVCTAPQPVPAGAGHGSNPSHPTHVGTPLTGAGQGGGGDPCEEAPPCGVQGNRGEHNNQAQASNQALNDYVEGEHQNPHNSMPLQSTQQQQQQQQDGVQSQCPPLHDQAQAQAAQAQPKAARKKYIRPSRRAAAVAAAAAAAAAASEEPAHRDRSASRAAGAHDVIPKLAAHTPVNGTAALNVAINPALMQGTPPNAGVGTSIPLNVLQEPQEQGTLPEFLRPPPPGALASGGGILSPNALLPVAPLPSSMDPSPSAPIPYPQSTEQKRPVGRASRKKKAKVDTNANANAMVQPLQQQFVQQPSPINHAGPCDPMVTIEGFCIACLGPVPREFVAAWRSRGEVCGPCNYVLERMTANSKSSTSTEDESLMREMFIKEISKDETFRVQWISDRDKQLNDATSTTPEFTSPQEQEEFFQQLQRQKQHQAQLEQQNQLREQHHFQPEQHQQEIIARQAQLAAAAVAAAGEITGELETAVAESHQPRSGRKKLKGGGGARNASKKPATQEPPQIETLVPYSHATPNLPGALDPNLTGYNNTYILPYRWYQGEQVDKVEKLGGHIVQHVVLPPISNGSAPIIDPYYAQTKIATETHVFAQGRASPDMRAWLKYREEPHECPLCADCQPPENPAHQEAFDFLRGKKIYITEEFFAMPHFMYNGQEKDKMEKLGGINVKTKMEDNFKGAPMQITLIKACRNPDVRVWIRYSETTILTLHSREVESAVMEEFFVLPVREFTPEQQKKVGDADGLYVHAQQAIKYRQKPEVCVLVKGWNNPDNVVWEPFALSETVSTITSEGGPFDIAMLMHPGGMLPAAASAAAAAVAAGAKGITTNGASNSTEYDTLEK